MREAFKFYHRAADLGSSGARRFLSIMYGNGHNKNIVSVLSDYGLRVSNDEIKSKKYLELAAMAGCSLSRYTLVLDEIDAFRFDRALKHSLIASSCGNIIAVNTVRSFLREGVATRDQYAQALRGYQQYLNEVRSDQRDQAAL